MTAKNKFVIEFWRYEEYSNGFIGQELFNVKTKEFEDELDAISWASEQIGSDEFMFFKIKRKVNEKEREKEKSQKMKLNKQNLNYKLQDKNQRWQLCGTLVKEKKTITSLELENLIKKNGLDKAFYTGEKVCVRLKHDSNWWEEI